MGLLARSEVHVLLVVMAVGKLHLREVVIRFLRSTLSIVASTGDEILSPDSVGDILDELLEAQNLSFLLGLKLKLQLHVVDAIHSIYSRPKDRLLHVLIAFTKQTDPRPTWRVIIDALRSPGVNLPHLAMKIEAAHFPDPTATRDVISETAPSGTCIT